MADNPPLMEMTIAEAGKLAQRCHREGRLRDAVGMYRQILEEDPDNDAAHTSLGCILLLGGEFEAGWREYEWRWVKFRQERPDFPQPRWDGGTLGGRPIFIHGEQGLGDNIQFIRYAPMVAAKGGPVVFGAPKGMRPLLSTVEGLSMVVEADEPIPPFSVHLPLLSLPRVLGTRLDTIPAHVPYLKADSGRASAWRERLSANRRPKVGICWQANPLFKEDHLRSVELGRFDPVLRVPGIDFYGLQVLHGREQMAGLDAGIPFTDIGPDLFSESDVLVEAAAAIEALDLVISVDTSICHLAGALGRPVWTALAFVPDWRWLLERDDSPWYPTMRLFRQDAPGDWDGVFRRIAECLRRWREEGE